MIFCLGTGKWDSEGEGYQKSYRVFNKDVTKDEYEKILASLSDIKILPTKWIEKKNVSAAEKKDIKIAKELGGYLKTFSCEDAWADFWAGSTIEERSKITSIPQFDATIFKEITGIEVKNIPLTGSGIRRNHRT